MAAPQSQAGSESAPEKLRVDKWLWQARFFKTRGLAAELAGSGRLRVNSEHVAKPVRPGDVLTFPQGSRIRVIRIEAFGHRRGPAREAQALYTDLDAATPAAASEAREPPASQRPAGTGRPTKKQRPEIDLLRCNNP